MWFNSTQREKPYPGFDIHWTGLRKQPFSSETDGQVLHGCRQLVS